MSLKLTIFDGATPMLDKIAEIHYGMGLDALDHAGSTLRDATRKALIRSSHNWWQKVKNGKRIIYKGGQRPTGHMMSHRTGSTHRPGNIASFITSHLMERSMTMVVAGKHKAFRAKTWRNGKVVGYQNRTSATGKASYAILKKLNDGGTYEEQSNDYKTLTRTKMMERFESARYQKRNYIEEGRGAAMGDVKEIMTKQLEKLIGQQINRVNVKARKVA